MKRSRSMFDRVLVLCTGNICRSPMAEALLAERLGPGYTVASAGVGALVGQPADPVAVELMDEQGIDIRGHRARQLSLEMACDHDLLLVMEEAQAEWIHSRFPMARGRVFRLDHWRGADIADPYRRGRAAFEQACRHIAQGVADWADRIQPERGRTLRHA